MVCKLQTASAVYAEIFTVRKFCSYLQIEKNLICEILPVCNTGILYQDLQGMLDDSLYCKHCYTIAKPKTISSEL